MTQPTPDDGPDTQTRFRKDDGPLAAPQAALSRDDLFHVLQARRRRLTLWYLHNDAIDGEASLRTVARHVAAAEQQTDVYDVDDATHQQVNISLRQSHLPKLDMLDVIDYDDARGMVSLNDLADVFLPYLTPEPEEQVTP